MRRRRTIVAIATIGASVAIVLATTFASVVLWRGRPAIAHQDRVFEAMVAAPIIAIEAEAAPPAVVVAPVTPPRPKRPRAAAIASPPARATPVVAPKDVAPPPVVAALPREAMPPPFAVVY